MSTTEIARRSIDTAAALLHGAERPVTSVNGNVVMLAAAEIAKQAASIPARVEIN